MPDQYTLYLTASLTLLQLTSTSVDPAGVLAAVTPVGVPGALTTPLPVLPSVPDTAPTVTHKDGVPSTSPINADTLK